MATGLETWASQRDILTEEKHMGKEGLDRAVAELTDEWKRLRQVRIKMQKQYDTEPSNENDKRLAEAISRMEHAHNVLSAYVFEQVGRRSANKVFSEDPDEREANSLDYGRKVRFALRETGVSREADDPEGLRDYLAKRQERIDAVASVAVEQLINATRPVDVPQPA